MTQAPSQGTEPLMSTDSDPFVPCETCGQPLADCYCQTVDEAYIAGALAMKEAAAKECELYARGAAVALPIGSASALKAAAIGIRALPVPQRGSKS